MSAIINQDTLFFFDNRPIELSLYEAFAQKVLERYPDAEVRVQKTQISFYEGRMFACVSMAPVRRRAERPERFITITFGLDHPLKDPRVVVVPVRPKRFTHHVIVGEAGEIDDRLMAWIEMGKRMK